MAPSKEKKIYKVKDQSETDECNHAKVSFMGVQVKLNKE